MALDLNRESRGTMDGLLTMLADKLVLEISYDDWMQLGCLMGTNLLDLPN